MLGLSLSVVCGSSAASGSLGLNPVHTPILDLSVGLYLIQSTFQSDPVSPMATAATQQRRYRPRRVSRPSDTTVGAPRRGDGSCNMGEIGIFTVLAPLSHLGKTTSAHPTFVWFTSEQYPAPVRFRLYPATASVPIVDTEVLSQAGITQFTLPFSQPGLKLGSYRWQIERICFPTRLEARADFEVVALPIALEERWYDLLAAALNDSPSDSDRDSVLVLLEDLHAVEAAAAQASDLKSSIWKTLLINQSRSLQQIIAIEQQRR